jgi:ABC-type antimicrobial peptide transport system permease subunit
MALGAQQSSVYRLILSEAGRLTSIGIFIGLACAIGAAAAMQAVLFGVRSWDIPTLFAVATILSAAALVASFVPARRAATVDPVVALRTE